MIDAMQQFNLRPLRREEWLQAGEVICSSIRDWYAAAGRPGRFPAGPVSCLVFPEVYEELDPGRCIVAEDSTRCHLAGLCFYHPRDTHISLGIMNVHPDYFGRGVGRQLLKFICEFADEQSKPLRLVSSAMNIDSFSLYTRAGFVPRDIFQVMSVKVPDTGFDFSFEPAARVRRATLADLPSILALEWEVSGIRRENDYRCFLANHLKVWGIRVIENANGQIDGVLVSINHPGSRMLGPGVMRTDADAAALILRALDDFRSSSPSCLVPAARTTLIQKLYQWGLRNSELSIFQSRGAAQPFSGVMMPTFMPETG